MRLLTGAESNCRFIQHEEAIPGYSATPVSDNSRCSRRNSEESTYRQLKILQLATYRCKFII